MRISRTGSASDHGTRSINFPSPTIEWSPSKTCLFIRQGAVKDFTSPGRHSYNIAISPSEVNAILNALAAAALLEPATIELQLAASLKALLQLQAVVAGVRT